MEILRLTRVIQGRDVVETLPPFSRMSPISPRVWPEFEEIPGGLLNRREAKAHGQYPLPGFTVDTVIGVGYTVVIPEYRRTTAEKDRGVVKDLSRCAYRQHTWHAEAHKTMVAPHHERRQELYFQ